MTTQVERIDIAALESRSREELMDLAREANISGYVGLRKEELVFKLLPTKTDNQVAIISGGILELVDDGYGFLRHDGLRPGVNDVYVSQSQIRRFGLRTGDRVSGQVRPPKNGEKYYGLLRVESVNSMEPDVAKGRPAFDDLTPIFPEQLVNLEEADGDLSCRLLMMLSPVGRGQRGLIVSPPKAGKTILLKQIANGMAANHDDLRLMVVLIGERPEEVTDMKRSVKGEVISSTFDEPVEDHTKVAEVALERAKRLVECGEDVVILLDSITRLTRAYNLAIPTSGRTLSGGIDPVALYPPKHFFGAARKCEEGGSLTILGTCLVDTGSRMDEVIYEEFKGTGNMEVHLDRKLAERRIFPAIDIQKSGTRREEKLLAPDTLKQVWLLRRMVSMISNDPTSYSEATGKVLERLAKTSTNAEFLTNLTREA
jgi:transcription termination factor Rho